MQFKAVAFAAFACIAVSSTASADVQMVISDGRVSLTAKDATLRQILAEWERVGHTKIVNADRVPGGPVTLQLIDVSEEQALDTLLRSLSGYVAAPREALVTNASRFERIVVMPTIAPVSAPAVAAGPSPATYPQPGMPPAFMNGQPQPIPGVPDDQDDDRPNARGPVFNTFPQPQVVQPAPTPIYQPTPGVPPAMQQQPIVLPQPNGQYPNQYPNPAVAYPGAPTAPVGTATPGAMPAPQHPNQPGQPVKRPSGQ
jgi:hypothetical protein